MTECCRRITLGLKRFLPMRKQMIFEDPDVTDQNSLIHSFVQKISFKQTLKFFNYILESSVLSLLQYLQHSQMSNLNLSSFFDLNNLTFIYKLILL